jgi:hypothetical protein
MRSEVAVFPHDDPRAVAAATATHTKQAKDGVPSRRERRRALYSPRSGQPAATVAVVAAPVAGP